MQIHVSNTNVKVSQLEMNDRHGTVIHALCLMSSAVSLPLESTMKSFVNVNERKFIEIVVRTRLMVENVRILP